MTDSSNAPNPRKDPEFFTANANYGRDIDRVNNGMENWNQGGQQGGAVSDQQRAVDELGKSNNLGS